MFPIWFLRHSPMAPPLSLLILLLFIACVSANLNAILNFSTLNSDFNFLGDASATTQDHIDLTTTQQTGKDSTGKFYYRNPFRFKNSTTIASFSTDFSFNISFASGTDQSPGDGMAFFIVADPKPMVGESSMGLGTEPGQKSLVSATNPFLAIEFDTYKNWYDPIGDHVGIDLNNLSSVAYYNGNNGSITLENLMHRAWIDYDAKQGLLEVRLANETLNGTALRPSEALLSAKNVNLSTLFPNKDSLYVGFSAATWDGGDLYQIYSWNFSITDIPASPSGSKPVSTILIIVIVIILFIILCAITCAIICLKKARKRKNRPDPEDNWESQLVESRFSQFRYADLSAATRRFSEKEILGKGAFGTVYKGKLHSDASMVAIKVMSTKVHQQFMAELSVIGRLRHKNLVSLKGWCHKKGKLFLVYEYMPNGSLDKYLFSPDHFLSWSERYEIVKGVADGLAFLHSGWDQRIVHRDIKAANVLLDSKFQARLGDFGLAKLMEDSTAEQTMTQTGTRGYIAPELAYLGKASEKSDIYSFGILLLEVACGRSIIAVTEGQEYLLDWVWEAQLRHELLIVADPQLKSDYNEEEMKLVLSLGLLCSNPDPESRPSMRRCFLILNGEVVLPELPDSKPTLLFGPLKMPRLSISALFSESTISGTTSSEDANTNTAFLPNVR